MLEAIGVSGRSESVYRALIESADCTVKELAIQCGLSHRQVQGALAELETLGLVSQPPGRVRRYLPAAPELAIEALIRNREDELSGLRHEVARLARAARQQQTLAADRDVVEVVHGREALARRWEQVQASARDEVRSFAKQPFLIDSLNNPTELKQLRAGLVHRAIYERSALETPGVLEHIQQMSEAGESARLAGRLPIKLFIADQHLAFAPLHATTPHHSAVLIHASALLDALAALFEQIWQNAIPVLAAAEADGTAERAALDPQGQQILQLLALGYTDEAIARRLDISHRGVQRRVKSLLDQLDAQTRFQAGLQAARRGWL